ncbi:MAG: serine hydrolase domain-containing protein [Balneolaceae bacterium]
MKTCKLVLVSLLFLASCQNQHTSDPASDLEDLLEEHNAVGLSVVMVKEGKIVYSDAFGMKNLEAETPLRTDDLFRIASISKSFSVTALMQLIEAGEISLDDDISDLVGFKVRNPHYPDTVITLRMMLSHTSSITDEHGYFTLDQINPDANPDWQESYNDYEPGTEYEYCNLAFNMIGAVIEKLTDTRFDQYIKAQVLDPLNLEGHFNVNELEADRLTPLYHYDSDTGTYQESPNAYASRGEEINDYTLGYSAPIFSPTGGLKISAIDLAIYMIMHMNYGQYDGERMISEESARAMQTPVLEESGYGLALRTFEEVLPGKTLVGHTGSAYGLYSAMAFDPEEKYGFVAITNGSPTEYVNGVNETLLEAIRILHQEFIE